MSKVSFIAGVDRSARGALLVPEGEACILPAGCIIRGWMTRSADGSCQAEEESPPSS